MNQYLPITDVLLEGSNIAGLREKSMVKAGYQSWKRIFDIVFSAVAIVSGAPLFLLVAMAVKLTSQGPVLFSQERIGLNGEPFTLFKFRSMIKEAHKQRDDLEAFNEVKGPIFKMQKDPRLTVMGRFLRKTSLDELPQFWNVLRGDMSIVGPRAHATDEVKNYRTADWRRLQVKPGLTCFWQIQGRSLIDFDTGVELDVEYIRLMSWKTDLRILIRTLPAVLSGRGAL